MAKLLSSKEFEKTSQERAFIALEKNGIKLRRISRASLPTPDFSFKYKDVAVEHSVFHTPIKQIEDVLTSYSAKGYEKYIVLTFEENKVAPKLVFQRKCNHAYSILRVKFDPESFYLKNLQKLDDEMKHFKGYRKALLFFDYSVAPFNLTVLSNMWSKVFDSHGMSYPKLIGIILAGLAAPRKTLEDIQITFIKNKYTKHRIPKELRELGEKPRDEYNIWPIIIYFTGDVRKIELNPPHVF